MKQHVVKIVSIKKITHDVLKIITKKPQNYIFIPGQATDISIYKNGLKDKKDLILSLVCQWKIIWSL